ncbi:hypothetical protein J0688_25240, partial [Vibrio parahaemolyticus]|nr:hypothetical protein [Vibrio parahaemolyticus]
SKVIDFAYDVEEFADRPYCMFHEHSRQGLKCECLHRVVFWILLKFAPEAAPEVLPSDIASALAF